MRALHLTLIGALTLAACEKNSVAPEQEETLTVQQSGVLADPEARRSARFDRLLERAKELDDPEAQELVEQLETTRDAARAALEAGDRETARELMTTAHEALRTLRTKLFPNAPDSLPGRTRRFDRQSRGDREARIQNLVDRIRAEGGAEAHELLDQALEAKNQIDAAKEAGDWDAGRVHAQALRRALRGALELTFPERLERMKERRGKMRQQ